MPYIFKNNITATELFDRVAEILDAEDVAPANLNKMMHQTLELVCEEGLKGNDGKFGNLFAKVDFLCKKHHVQVGDAIAVQKMRRDTNHSQPLLPEDLLYDCRALCIFISAVMDVDVPQNIIGKIPVINKLRTEKHHIDYRYIRSIVKSFDSTSIIVEIDQDANERTVKVDYTDEALKYLKDVIQEGMQLNLLDCELQPDKSVKPRIIVVEPDFLIDISSIARCFTDYGHHPLSYIVNRMSPSANSQAILLGNFASSALDDIINSSGRYHWVDTFRTNFKEKALEYCTCSDLNRKEPFKTAAVIQTRNIEQIVGELFKEGSEYDRKKTILEPSFVCEQLGIQGRVDLMTTDFKLLVEQKSGSNYNIQINRPNEYGSFQKEEHYVQLLLYYGVLRQNFHLNSSNVDIRLLYSKYPLPGGLVTVSYYQKLFHDAIHLRNLIVAYEYYIARNGFGRVIDHLSPDTLNAKHINTQFYLDYIFPRLNAITAPLHNLSPLEKAYLCRMMTFVYREQLASKVGIREGTGNSGADLWNMPLAEKKETGNIYTGLRITNQEKSSDFNGYDTITLAVPDQGEDFLPNFRQGDMIYLYAYHEGQEPDVRASILYKGSMAEIRTDRLTVHLNDGQQNPNIFTPTDKRRPYLYAIEHGGSDIGTGSAIRSLQEFITSSPDRKALLLSQRAPRCDKNITLTHSYHPNYDDILLRAKQAKDYFLLIGPPGTGKTSMALRYLVEEELAQSTGNSILLMSYTNRAVDEICGMLCDAGIGFMRIGNEYTCDERFRPYLINHAIDDSPMLESIKQKILATRIFVGTTSSMLSHADLFNLKHFSLAIIDEASQILEPNIVGLLANHQGQEYCPELSIGKFILIGDYKQLPAVVQQDADMSAIDDPLLTAIGLTDCRDSLFERLIRWEHSQGRTDFVGILRKQGRMHPDIAEFPNRMFYFREQLEIVPCEHQLAESLGYDLPSEDRLDDVLKAHRMIFIPSKPCRQPNISEKVNTEEAHIVADLLRRIHRFYGNKFDAQKTVGVIVPYRNQIAMIRKEIERFGIPALDRISIDTVERYQGSQRDVIIYSFTVQCQYQLDFLTSNCFEEDGRIIDRKLNVAITRARKQMIVTGNVQTLSNNLVFSQLIDYIKGKNGYFE
jgi:DNA replication ATP-dependent helicase Dna2